MNISHIKQKIRRQISQCVKKLMPDFDNFKRKIRLIKSMYVPFQLKNKSDKKRVICIYKEKSPDSAGLADRLKAMVSSYIIAKENGASLYIYHDLGFQLTDYLLPNSVDWFIEKEDISWGLNKVHNLWFTSEVKKIKTGKKEIHPHFTWDVTAKLNDELKQKYSFYCCFHRLFKPSPKLSSQIDNTFATCGLVENNFVAVHARFLDFFETVETKDDTAFTRHASPEEQVNMLESMKKTLRMLHEKTGKSIVLFSDSKTFLSAEHEPYVMIIPGEVGHVYAKGDNSDVVMKAFLDMFVISKAASVYNIVGDGLYPSGYSYMGARIGNKKFERVSRIR